MQRSSPSSKKSIYLGFFGITLIFIGIFHFVFSGDFTLETIISLEHIIDIISPALGFMLIIYVQILDSKTQEEKQKEIYNHPKVVGFMTGASYFFLTVISLFIILPMIALVWFWLKGEI